MSEVRSERKTGVDAVHLAGHDPVFIEAEPRIKTEESRRTMDLMINRSEVLLTIVYLTLGRIEELLDHRTPVDYEFHRFREVHPAGKMFLFCKQTDVSLPRENQLRDWIEARERQGIEIVEFRSSADLAERIVERVAVLPLETAIDVTARRVVRVESPDYIGLVQTLSETLYSQFGANIDYISQGARSGRAAILIGCSFREKEPASLRKISKTLHGALVKDLEAEQAVLRDQRERYRLSVDVDEDDSSEIESEFFVQIRTINTPGQLNAVCKVLRKLRFNLDDVTLRPAPPEYPRQTTIAMWLSRRAEPLSASGRDIDRIAADPVSGLARLEFEIRDVVGVRAFSIRALRHDRVS